MCMSLNFRYEYLFKFFDNLKISICVFVVVSLHKYFELVMCLTAMLPLFLSCQYFCNDKKKNRYKYIKK